MAALDVTANNVEALINTDHITLIYSYEDHAVVFFDNGEKCTITNEDYVAVYAEMKKA